MMQWWIQAPNQAMAVDNQLVLQMDLSLLPSDVFMVQWRENKGEVELTTGTQLRTVFSDVTPYAPFFQQFMTLLPGITTTEAKKIQTDLITVLYENKRQLPYYHPVAAGNFSWDATDPVVAAMSAATMPSLLGGTSSSGNTLVSNINAQIADLTASINTMIGQVNSRIADQGNAHVGFTNTNMLGTLLAGLNTINGKLVNMSVVIPSGGGSATIGLTGAIAPSTVNFTHADPVSSSPLTPGSGPGAATVPFTPIGQATPVTLSVTEISDILGSITNRRTSLLTTQTNKITAVNALTTVPDIIAYDVTAGW